MVYKQITLNVTNASDNTPITGALVFIDGSRNFDPNQFSVVTDASGNATFQVPTNLGNRVMQVTAIGFQSSTQVINTVSLLAQSIHISLNRNVTQSALVSFQFVPAVAGITWQLIQGITTVTTGVSDIDGSSQTGIIIPFGAYTVSASLPSYALLTESITVNGQIAPYTFTLIGLVDPTLTQLGNTNGSSLALTNAPESVVSQVTTEPPVANEYIYPNTDFDKYFTITGARIYIGNLFIDEVSSVQYAVQDNAIPVYGYASRFVDAYGQGRSLVQGQLTLNFVTEGYLYTVLQEYKKYLSSTQGKGFPIGSPQVDTVAQVLGLMATRDSIIQQMNHNPNIFDSAAFNNVNPEVQADKLQASIKALMNGMSSDQIESLSNLRQRQLTTFSDVIGFNNPVYQDVLFDLRVELGNAATGVQRIRYIEKCKLISNEQVIAPDGQTLLDSYGFIGRRLR